MTLFTTINIYINTKIRSYNNDIKTNFRDIDNKNNKLPEKKTI